MDKTLFDNVEVQEVPASPTPDGTLVDAPASPVSADAQAPTVAPATYEILGELGRGGMSVVYRARDAGLRREVALKRLLPNYASSEKAIKRLLAEARAIANVQHPNIVHVYAVGQDEQGPFIAMELVVGSSGHLQTLDAKIKRDGPLKVDEAVELVRQLCGAAQAAYDKGIFHYEIDPSNVLLTAHDEPKLADLGIAHVAADPLHSLDFMAPERQGGALEADARANVYALGGVLYFCLTGKTMWHFWESEVPAGLRKVVLKATAREPKRRHATASAFSGDLQSALQNWNESPRQTISNGSVIAPTVHGCPACGVFFKPGQRFCEACGKSLQLEV